LESKENEIVFEEVKEASEDDEDLQMPQQLIWKMMKSV
jgi:hypothetical protein